MTREKIPGSIDDLGRPFDANVFGVVAMIKAVLPGRREVWHGHIVNVTSMSGFITKPGISFYCGRKFALDDISETLLVSCAKSLSR